MPNISRKSYSNMEVSNYIKKFKLLLDNVLDGKIVLNDYYTEKLLKFLEDVTDKSPGQLLLVTPCFSDIIFEYVHNMQDATTTTKVFLFELFTILLKDELQFSKMQMQGFQALSVKCVLGNMSTSVPPPALHLACIKLATVHLSHCSGINFILKHKVWEHVLSPNTHERPKKIANAAYDFISKLVWKLSDHNKESEVFEVLQFVVNPIKASDYLHVQDIDPEIDKRSKDEIYTYLKALLTILSATENIIDDNKIVLILKRQLFIEHDLFKILCVSRCPSIVHLINDTMMRLFIAMSQNTLFSGETDDFCNTIVAFYHNYISNLLKKRSLLFIIDYVIQCNIIWSNLEKSLKIKRANIQFPLTFERNGHKLEFRNQFIVHLVVPLLEYALNFKDIEATNVIVEQITAKLGKTVTEHIYSSCYSLRTILQGHDMKQATIHTIRELSRLKGHMSTSQAGLIFQNLYYVLEIFILSDGAGGLILSENPLKTPDDVKLLSLLLNVIRMLLQEHNISWYENVEIVNLQAGLMNLLKQKILQTTQLVQVLDLIDLCVKKFLSPNMTLLVDSEQGSTLTEIGAIMTMYIQHEDWEVRDSALNLLLSCTDIAFIKYIPLQKVINENNLMIYATQAAMTDPEFYAQTTALKCLATATKIESIWREVVASNAHICIQLFYIVRNNPEGMVRKEAVNVLTQIYTTKKVSQSFKTTLYEIMVNTALNDLHWEVQLAALKFWQHAIQSQLTYRGMIDGKFPSVTFSKEKRKIVVLNDKEIVRSLTCIMNDLSSIGCLTVLLECMNEDYNIEVMEQAYIMARELLSILDHYKFKNVSEKAITYREPDVEIKEEIDEMVMDLSYVATNEEARDKVIDNILNTAQSELLIDLHDRLGNTTSNDVQQSPHKARKENIHPNKFIEIFRGTDYLSTIKGKKNWNAEIGSLDALLDEMLAL